ncbi:MAG: phage integrase N-terminal SAM-like domain-containing protein [Rhodocyclaceae bacterium]|nr:phage integrase N-terminal SAM-like domain-containing protein [Rhodocyclaceae bacterium]
MKPGKPPLQSTRVLDQVRERIRYLHYSLSTEKRYLYWVRFFIRWHGRAGKMIHPGEMGVAQVKALFDVLVMERNLTSVTHEQVTHVLRFLDQLFLTAELPKIGNAKIPPVGAGETPLSYSDRFPDSRSFAGRALWNT